MLHFFWLNAGLTSWRDSVICPTMDGGVVKMVIFESKVGEMLIIKINKKGLHNKNCSQKYICIYILC